MPRLVNQNPAYRKHRASGQAIVTLNGRDVYLGPHGTKASRDEYDRVVGEWQANGRRRPDELATDLTMSEILLRFLEHAEQYYRRPDGTQTTEVAAFREIIKMLRKPYGRTPAAQFGPLALKAMQQEMINRGWCRKSINKHTSRIKHIFKWATSNELIPATVFHALQSVSGLRMGRSRARESEPVRPVPEAHVYAIKDFVSRQVWAMIELQMVTGMRPGEVCIMRPIDIDTSGKLWMYRPERHKTQHHGHAREIYLGARAQAIVAPFLQGRPTHAYLFSPVEAEAERRAELHESRRTPLKYGNAPGTNRKRKPARPAGERYNVTAYRRAIARGCEEAFGMPTEIQEPRLSRDAAKANTPEKKKQRREARAAWRADHGWHPHQLRHNAATRLRKEYGLEAAQVILGHKTLAVTEVYAEKNVEAAKRIMAEVG